MLHFIYLKVPKCLEKFRDTSGWDPEPFLADHPIEQYISILLANVSSPNLQSSFNKYKKSLTKIEYEDMKSLQNNKYITILPADKGDKTVILSM